MRNSSRDLSLNVYIYLLEFCKSETQKCRVVGTQVTIAITSATGQLFIFYTIKTFGPVVFTIIMTTRQMFSIVLSLLIFGHSVPLLSGVGATIVFGTIFWRIKRQAAKAPKKPTKLPSVASPKQVSSGNSPQGGRLNL